MSSFVVMLTSLGVVILTLLIGLGGPRFIVGSFVHAPRHAGTPAVSDDPTSRDEQHHDLLDNLFNLR